MIKVIIIDDEPLVRLGLKSMLQWEQLGFAIAGEAVNGRQGLDLIIEQQPDIVITDIKMPVMDGLTMMRLALEKQPRLKFIILSSYDEFQLVKQAMKQGAEEYLIKLDLQAESLLTVLTEIRAQLAQTGSFGSGAGLERDRRENVNLLREGFLKRIINQPPQSEAEIRRQLAGWGFTLETVLCCALIRITNPRELEKYEVSELCTLEKTILNMVDEIVNDVFKGYTFIWELGQFATIISSGPGITPERYHAQMANLGERLVQIVKQYFNISIAVGFGNSCHGFHKLRESYCQALRAIQYCLYSATRSVLCFSELPTGGGPPVPLDIGKQKTLLLQALELGDPETITDLFATFGAIISEPQATPEQAYDLCLQIAYLVIGAPGTGTIDFKATFGYQNSLYESVLNLTTRTQLQQWLISLERSILRRQDRNDGPKNQRLIAKTKKYILDHYQEEIGLNEVAAVINLSPGYFSTIFRQETGVCFTEYVTEVKIGQAKRLLQEAEYKIYEIAAMLGYQNAYYFSKVFKKVTGMTPSQYSGQQG
jgi:two-component system response regulator YesN